MNLVRVLEGCDGLESPRSGDSRPGMKCRVRSSRTLFRTLDFGLWTLDCIICPWQPRGAALKERPGNSVACQLPALAPLRAVLDDPVRQRALKADVATSLFRLDPFMFQNLFAFCLELPIKGGVLQQIARRELLFRFVGHSCKFKFS